MSTLIKLDFKKSDIFLGIRNEKGQLCNKYAPLQNLTDFTTAKLGDFTTADLNFDMEHPVDIIPQESYDGSVNLILNDGKNVPRLINSRFAVLDENTFKIPDHLGFKDTNIYDSHTFDSDTRLKAIPIKIPIVSYDGLIENGGKLNCGSYTFFFKLADADGNETEVIAESGVVQCHIGNVNDPYSMRMGMLDENSGKAILFTLTNIDAGFDFVRVLFTRSTSGNDLASVETCHKILFDYPVNKEGVCLITVAGVENILPVSKSECTVDYADINSVKTQTVNNNILLFGNSNTPIHNWDEIKRFTWKIIPYWEQCGNIVGDLKTEDYTPNNLDSDTKCCYYNTKNVYYRLGYWPDEIYRFGIVYIFNDNSLSPAINLLGVDFGETLKLSLEVEEGKGTSDYEKLFFSESKLDITTYPEYLYETDSFYFKSLYRTNSRGVFKFPIKDKDNQLIDVVGLEENVISPKPLCIKFDLSLIGVSDASSSTFDRDNDWKEVLKKHNIKGYFFVRLKRVPTILGLGVIINHSLKDYGSLPFLQDAYQKVSYQSFLDEERFILEDAVEKNNAPMEHFDTRAMLCPEAEVNEATYNQLFTSTEYCVLKTGKLDFNHNHNNYTVTAKLYDSNTTNTSYLTKLTNVPEDTKLVTNGTDYFSTLAGNPNEPWKTVDLVYEWKKTVPQLLTLSTSLIRGKWGPYVGMNNPLGEQASPFAYGEVVTIKTKNYLNEANAIDLDFLSRMNSNDPFFAISHRMGISYLSFDSSNNSWKTIYNKEVLCFRGDCYINLFTHRMFRNFIDPELPTNHLLVDPSCWRKNYGVRCTATIATRPTSNLMNPPEGWYINSETGEDIDAVSTNKDLLIALYFLTGNIGGAILALKRYDDTLTVEDAYTGESLTPKEYYDKYGYANEIVQAFEVYVGRPKLLKGGNSLCKYEEIMRGAAYRDDGEPRKKKVDPKELETSGGLSLKAIFKSDDSWSLRGLASINRADVNAVAMGLWVTFPICSSRNLALRDVDFSNATEEASFNRKRGFVPHEVLDRKNPLRDSNVINLAAAITIPSRAYLPLPKVPYFKLEYFTRIINSLRDSANSITNEFKVMLESSYKDYAKTYGSITKLESRGNSVYVIFKHGIGILNMTASLSLAQNANEFLPEISMLPEHYGSIWKDSIILTSLGIYGVDSVAKVIWRVNEEGFLIISDMKVGKFLIDNLDMSEFNFKPYIGHINIKSHYNAFKHDVMFTYYRDLLYLLPNDIPVLDKNTVDVDELGFVIDKNSKERILNSSGNCIAATLLLPYYDKDKGDWVSYSDLIAKYDLYNESFPTIMTRWVKSTNWSLCWNEELKMFLTFYDWIPIESSNIDNIYFSFDRDQIDGLKLSLKDYILPPVVYGGIDGQTEVTTPLEVPYKKNLIDNAFTGNTLVTTLKNSYGTRAHKIRYKSNNAFSFIKGKVYAASFYLWIDSDPGNIELSIVNASISTKISTNNNVVKLPKQEWVFCTCFFKYSSDSISAPIFEFSNIVNNILTTIKISEFKIVEYDGEINTEWVLAGDTSLYYQKFTLGSYDSFLKCYTKNLNGMFKDVYNLRNSSNSLLLWKHGLAGIYDNLGEIKPTNWYGKLHEFNFEFVVNNPSVILKIYNNLKMISNKTTPYKFEYEIVGEAYDWYQYKEIVFWINLLVKNGIFTSLDNGYKEVLLKDYGTLRSTYSDFPVLFGKGSSYKIPKLPYLEIKLTDKKGLPDKDRSYTSTDKWSSLPTDSDHSDNYKYNTSEAIIVLDKLLNEYRIHTELYCNDMKKYGRVRGNIQYLEDLWDVEIRPISFKWVCIPSNSSELSPVKTSETRLRDKYIKIKVRYSGEDLAVILAISTMYEYSRA